MVDKPQLLEDLFLLTCCTFEGNPEIIGCINNYGIGFMYHKYHMCHSKKTPYAGDKLIPPLMTGILISWVYKPVLLG